MKKARKIIDAIFNAGQNSMLDSPEQEVVVEHYFNQTKYNRRERRQGSFVIKNVTNGKYAVQFKRQGKTVYRDGELDEASLFAFNSVELVMNAIWLNEPNVDLDYEMAYRGQDGVETK